MRADAVLDKAAFFRAMGYTPHSGQQPIHDSCARRRVVACGVRWGKTVCAAMEGLAAAMVPAERSVGWVVAPTYDLTDRVFKEIALVAARHLRHRILTMRDHDRFLRLRNLGGGICEIRGKSADNPVSLLGEGLNWVIVDEAARLKPSIWESHLSQRLLDRQGWALLISTPRGKGWLYDMHLRGQRAEPDHQSWNLPSWTNPFLNRQDIESERGRLPERVFRQEYGAEFLEGSGSVFRYVRERATGDWGVPQAGTEYWGGLDLAKIEDYTVLVIVDGDCRVQFVDRFHRVDWSIAIDRVRAAADRFGRARLLVDSTGAGEPVFESLARAGCRVQPYPFTARSKADLVNNLAVMLERNEVVLPKPGLWPEGIDELEAYEYAVTDQGNVKTGAPAGQHDDCAVAMMLAAWQVRPSRPVHRCTVSPLEF